jgi:fibronectin type III domain protein
VRPLPGSKNCRFVVSTASWAGWPERTLLRAAERLQITIDPGSADHPLSYWDTTSHTWAAAPGAYGVQVGSSSQNLPLSGSFRIAR